jgi:hypothetical protein
MLFEIGDDSILSIEIYISCQHIGANCESESSMRRNGSFNKKIFVIRRFTDIEGPISTACLQSAH